MNFRRLFAISLRATDHRNIILSLASLLAIFALTSVGITEQRTHGPATGRWATAIFAGGCFWCPEADFSCSRQRVVGRTGLPLEQPGWMPFLPDRVGPRCPAEGDVEHED